MEVTVFGAGISGLSAAHHLMERGYNVTVYEATDKSGGLARSDRSSLNEMSGVPSEYSWRGFGPWYHNTFELMKKIPSQRGGNIFDDELSNDMQFFIASDVAKPSQNPQNFANKLSKKDLIKFGWDVTKTYITSGNDSSNKYKQRLSGDHYRKILSKDGAKIVNQSLGPWTGSDSERASTYLVSNFIVRTMFPGPNALNGPVGWAVLKGPSNELWFDPWVKHLEDNGVVFNFNSKLVRLIHSTVPDVNSGTVQMTGVIINQNCSEYNIQCDKIVLAVNPYSTLKILQKTPKLMYMSTNLQNFEGLTSDTPHVQISFRLIFSDEIQFGKIHETAIVFNDSEFDITLFSQDAIFHDDISLGTTSRGDVKTLWSGTATIDSIPGRLYNLPMNQLTKDQFIEEVLEQIFRCDEFDNMIKKYNNGQGLQDFNTPDIEVWNSWEFPNEDSSDKVRDSSQPKWVNNTENFKYLPNTISDNINGLYLAGAHTKTNANIYSMEAAVESGKRAADLISDQDTVIPQHTPFALSQKNSSYTWWIIVILLIVILVVIIYFSVRKWR
ncbi:MAG: FAD-dependent oxidoreductase [Colwellia sp.]|nr:FAD-dependent oxidoreductase [Colwellia sp.]